MVEHQMNNVLGQIRGGYDKSICLCQSMYKGGGNNAVTYIIELYDKG